MPSFVLCVVLYQFSVIPVISLDPIDPGTFEAPRYSAIKSRIILLRFLYNETDCEILAICLFYYKLKITYVVRLDNYNTLQCSKVSVFFLINV